MTDQFPTPDSLDVLAKPHPYFAEMLDAMRAGAIPQPDMSKVEVIQAGRAARSAATDASYGISPPTVKETTQSIKLRDGTMSEIRVFQPSQTPSGGSPLFLLFYGGGFVMGNNKTMTPYARALVQLYGAVVINATYRLAPEHPFPEGHNDSWDTFLWTTQHAAELGADPSVGFIVGGISAGGNITAVVAQNAIDQGIKPAITGLWLCIPVIFSNEQQIPEDLRPFWKSREQNAIAPVINAKFINAVNGHLAPDVNSPWYCISNSKTAFEKWPRAYIEVNGLDPLRDDSIIMEKILRKKGTETKMTVWPGLPHAHFAFFPEEDFSKKSMVDTVKGLGWLLQSSEPTTEQILKVAAPPKSA